MIIQKEGNRVPDRVMFDTSQGRFGPFWQKLVWSSSAVLLVTPQVMHYYVNTSTNNRYLPKEHRFDSNMCIAFYRLCPSVCSLQHGDNGGKKTRDWYNEPNENAAHRDVKTVGQYFKQASGGFQSVIFEMNWVNIKLTFSEN
jgi:hypothetical protein